MLFLPEIGESMCASVKQENLLRILVVDDFAEWRVRIHSILQSNPQLQVIGEACNGLQAVQKAAELLPDVVLLDIGMPILNGIEAAIQIREVSPDTRVIFVTQENDSELRTAAIAAGAEQYLVKANAAKDLLPAVEAALGNGHYSPNVCA
jgi:DNA-binding NarL/FixJ family response regulator